MSKASNNNRLASSPPMMNYPPSPPMTDDHLEPTQQEEVTIEDVAFDKYLNFENYFHDPEDCNVLGVREYFNKVINKISKTVLERCIANITEPVSSFILERLADNVIKPVLQKLVAKCDIMLQQHVKKSRKPLTIEVIRKYNPFTHKLVFTFPSLEQCQYKLYIPKSENEYKFWKRSFFIYLQKIKQFVVEGMGISNFDLYFNQLFDSSFFPVSINRREEYKALTVRANDQSKKRKRPLDELIKEADSNLYFSVCDSDDEDTPVNPKQTSSSSSSSTLPSSPSTAIIPQQNGELSVVSLENDKTGKKKRKKASPSTNE